MTTEFPPSSRNLSANVTEGTSEINGTRIFNDNDTHNTNGANGKMSRDKSENLLAVDANPTATNDRTPPPNTDTDPKMTVTQPTRFRWLQWLSNFKLGQKQLISILATELIAVVGLVGAGSFLIITNGRSELAEQAKSELALQETEYNIKIDQMGLGFRNQSNNSALVDVAQLYAEGESPSTAAIAATRQLLENTLETYQIEYATLVGDDLRIIASANGDRAGEKFDPQGLVGTVLQNPRQVKVSAIVSQAELQNEQPSLPTNFSGEDALIRYTLTPITDPTSGTALGVLVSGDIVNGKPAIVENTLNSFETGYSAIYQYQADGGFTLATSLNIPDGGAAAANISLETSDLLEQATAADGEVVSGRAPIGDETYTLAAKAIENFNGEPVAILVRGTSEASLNALVSHSLKLQLGVAAIALTGSMILAQLLGRSILKRVKNLHQAAWQFGMGDRSVRADIFSTDELGQVAQSFNQLADNITNSEALLQQQKERQGANANRARLLADLTTRIRQSLDPATIVDTAVEGIKGVLAVDRVLFYRFNTDLTSGEITSEAVDRPWKQAKGSTIEDPLTPEALARYRTGQVTYMENREQAKISHCHCEILERLEVKANMVAPLSVGDALLGLLCVHKCSAPHKWEPEEIDLLQQLAVQISAALTQARLLTEQRKTVARERQLAEITGLIRQSLDEESIFATSVEGLREVLNVDRMLIYRFSSDFKSGEITAESVVGDWVRAKGTLIEDPLTPEDLERYYTGHVTYREDRNNEHEAGAITHCHCAILERLQVQANMVAPLFVGDNLIGLLCAHQCSGPRRWDELEINFVKQVAIQLGFAVEQARLFSQTQALSEEHLLREQELQAQLVQLLTDVEGASQGDLTVRADVTAGEIGTVADFFNAIVESLRQIVIKVKQSAELVNVSVGENEGAVESLAQDALKQAEEVTHILTPLDQMTRSIQQVADSAQQTALVANNASSTAETSGQAMDLTVQNILNLREIIGETSKKVKRLGESSQQISKVVSLINQIAMQTNLLAINAGIEAARAGEEGQGFAVVAEEVGELAARSADATQEIERIVETIQRETVEVVDAMEQSTTEVVAGTRLVEDAKQNLSRILEVSMEIDELAQSVSEATVSQVEVSETVTYLMQDIAQVSRRTSESSLQISDSLRQTINVARALQESVGMFKTGE
ncbi:MAG: GAF domain-containing protein [Leptolyngbya sp. SIO1E4]|nr:GAF domain-containing protein [Leptolyngbya sp. SIO1E4]